MSSLDAPLDADVPAGNAVAPRWAPLTVTWDVDGTVRDANQAYAEQLGLSRDDVLGHRWPDLAVGEEEVCWRQLQLTLDAFADADLAVTDMPTRISGRTEWFRWTEVAGRDPAGRLVQVHSTGIEITELYEARSELASAIDDLAAARDLGRQDVLEQLHNGAVQQLTAARWAVAADDPDDAARLIDAALAVVRSSMASLEPSADAAARRLPPDDPFWQWVAGQSSDGSLPAHLRQPLFDVVSDAVAVISSTGSVWLDPDTSLRLFRRRTDVDLPTMLSALHPDDRAEAASMIVRALAGENVRVRWRYRHPEEGWRQMSSWLTPLAPDSHGPRMAVALSMDITRDDGDPVRDVMAARLEERRLVAQTLHDDVLQQVAGLRWSLGEHPVGTAVIAELDDLEASVRERLRELDSPVWRFGLEAALLHLVDATVTPVELHVSCEAAMSSNVADVVWRSAREALRNVDRHAAAASATVDVQCRDGQVRLVVCDNGRGIDDERLFGAVRAGHFGVASMREAATAMGGTFELRGGSTAGAELRMTIPAGVD